MPRKHYRPQRTEPEKRYAVIVAADYDDQFFPATECCPSALLTVANKIILYHQIDHLEDHLLSYHIYVYCEQRFLKEMKQLCQSYSKSYRNMTKIEARSTPKKISLGEVMRDIYSSKLIDTDFLLFECNSLANMDFEEVLVNHREAVKENDKFVITRLFTERTEFVSGEKGSIVQIFTGEDGQLLKYSTNTHKVSLEGEEDFDYVGDLEMTRRCVDSHVSVCRPIVTSLFADNMDYDSFEDLVQGLLAHEKMQGYFARTELRSSDYASSVTTFKSMHTVSCALLGRLADPINPDYSNSGAWRYNHIYPNHYYFSAEDGNAYGKVCDYTIVDSGCLVGKSAELSYTLLGKFVTVGENSVLEYSTIMDNVTIGDNCQMKHCYVAPSAQILDNVVLEECVYIGEHVVVGPNVVIPKNTRLDLLAEGTEPAPKELIGEKGEATLIEEEYSYGIDEYVPERDCDASSIASSNEDGRPTGEMPPKASDDPIFDQEPEDGRKLQDFGNEVKNSMRTSLEEKADVAHVWAEITAVRLTYMLPIDNETVVYFVTQGVLELAEKFLQPGEEDSVLKSTVRSFRHFMSIFIKYTQKTSCRLPILKALQNAINHDDKLMVLVPKLIVMLYNQESDVMDEETILEWYYKILPEDNPIRSKMETYVEYLEEAEEESSEDE